jgi:hypothetical protein
MLFGDFYQVVLSVVCRFIAGYRCPVPYFVEIGRQSLIITCHITIACKEQDSSVGTMKHRDQDSRV